VGVEVPWPNTAKISVDEMKIGKKAETIWTLETVRIDPACEC